MTLQQLTYLVTVAECGNITDAAERLFLSQPSLSAAIHNLEKEMGVTAFVRSNKGVTVTQEGEELLSFARIAARAGRHHAGALRRGQKARAQVLRVMSALFVRGERIRRGCQGVRRGPVRFLSCGKHRPVRSLMMWRRQKRAGSAVFVREQRNRALQAAAQK